MSYPWPIDLEDLFEERYAQMLTLGLPQADVDALRSRVQDMWSCQPGGWTVEWSELAAGYAAAGHPQSAALAYGYAKFPTLADEAKRAAYRNQIEQYVVAAAAAPVDVERRTLQLEHRGASVPVTVHQFSAPGVAVRDAPVLIASGGVDTWKEDLHALWVACCQGTGMTVLAFDIAGTGESTVPMTPDGGAQIVSGLVRHARKIGNGKVAHIGISMGGHFSARTGLTGEVDAAVVIGGPTTQAFSQPASAHSNIGGIIGNALGFDAPPTDEKLRQVWSTFSLEPLFAQPQTVPMFVINGADDPLFPQADTLVFQGREHTDVTLVPDAGHCAASKLPEVMQSVIGWLGATMGPAVAA